MSSDSANGNGDWISPAVLTGKTKVIVYPADAAPLFMAGEYLDVHSTCTPGERVLVAVWHTAL